MASTYDEYVPELGVIVSFPVGVSEEAKQRFIQRKLSGGAPAPTPTPPTSSTMDDVLRNVSGFALGVPRGIIEGIAAVPEGIGGITGSELLKSTGAAIRDNPLSNLFAGEASTGRMAGELIGNLATFLAPGSIAKLAGAPRLATGLSAIIGGASGAAEQVREAEQNRAAGMQVTPEQEQTAAIMGVAPGLAETLIPFGRLTRNLAPGLAGAAQIAGEGLGAQAARIGQSAVIGGLTEGAQRGLQNVIEQQVYNPQQDALEGIVQEAGIGAVAEGGLEGLIGFLTKRVAVKGLRAKQQRVREGDSPTVEAGAQDAVAVETTAEGLPSFRYVGRERINPYAPFAGASTSEAVGTAPPTGPIPAPPEVPFFPMSSTYGMARMPSPMLPTIDEFGNIVPAGEVAPPPGATIPTGGPGVPVEAPTLPDYMRGLSPEDLALAEDIRAMLPVEAPPAPRDIVAEQQRGASILEELMNPRPPYIEPVTPSYSPTAPISLTPEGTFRQPSNLYTDIPRVMRGTGVPVTPIPTIQERVAADIEQQRVEQRQREARVAEEARQREAQAAVDAETRRAQARTEMNRMAEEQRRRAALPAAPRSAGRPTVPETGVPDERVLDAQQRLAREEFNKNLAELNPDELAIVQAKQESGLGTAVRPQEISEVQEFADLPFTRDQYRQAVEIGKTTAATNLPKRFSTSLGISQDAAQTMVDTMINRGDATVEAGRVRINPAATGPRFSVETQTTPEPAPAPEPITVEAFRQRIARGEIPEVPSQIHSELKALGVDDLLSARLVDSLGNPQVAGQYANRIVSLALAGRSPDQLRSTLNHEVVHALKELKIFSTAEWNLLQNTLTPSAVLSEDEQKFYSDLYKDDPEALAEEAIARGMQKFIDGRMDLPRPAAAAVEKTTSVFSKLGDLFRERGLETPEQVIGAFRAGEIGRRQLPGETSTAGTQPTVAARQPNTADTTSVRDLETLLGRTDSEGYVIPEERPRLSYVGERAYSEDPIESARIASFRESAMKMEQAVEDPEKIRLATGWFRNPYDQMLRYEVGDQGASLTQAFRDLPESPISGRATELKEIPLEEALDHPDLFRAYPELKKVRVIKQPGAFDFRDSLQGYFDQERNILNITPSAKDPASTMLHEIQHWIQAKEGFAPGGNENLAVAQAPKDKIEKIILDAMDEKQKNLDKKAQKVLDLKSSMANLRDLVKKYPDLVEEYELAKRETELVQESYRDGSVSFVDYRNFKEWPDEVRRNIIDRVIKDRGLSNLTYREEGNIRREIRNALEFKQDKLDNAESEFMAAQDELSKIRRGDPDTINELVKGKGFELYEKIAGEIESRDVQARQRMTPEERRKSRPLTSENISPYDAITIRPGAPTPRLSIEQEPVPNPLFAQPDPRKSIGQRAAETLQLRPSLPSEIRTQVIDRRAPIAQLARAAGTIGKAEVSSEEAVRRLDQANDLAIAGLKFGAVEFVGKPGNGYFIASEGAHPLGSDGYMVRMAEIGKLDKFFHYLAGLRSTALGEREKQLTPAQIRQFLSYGNDPRIKQAAAEHKQFNDGMIDAVVASGRFSKAEGERLKRDMYIPYLRISQTPEGDIRFTAGGSNLASSPKLKALKGGLGQARDPLATYVENVQMLTTMALKNEAMNRISRDGIQTGYIRPARKGDENTVPVWVNGQKKRMAILDPELYESVTYAPQPLSGMVKILALPARFLRSSVVFNPIYPIRNLIRDSQQVFAQGYTDMPLVSALDGVRKALTRSESYRDLERFGVVSSNIRGEGGGEGTAREARATFDDSLLGAVSKGIRAFEDFNQRFEAANRVVVYENLLKRGRTKAQAAAEARELINFNRHGANLAMRTLSALIPFQNARIQGADVLYRAAGTKDNPEMTRQLYNRSVMLAALSMVYAATIQSNPAYQSASKEEQENNWFVPLPDGQAIRVPIPFELGWFVKVVPEKLAQMMNGTADGKAFLESFRRFVSSTMKLEVTPQAIKPFQEAMVTNFNDFTQRPVEQDYMKRLELADRYDERTTLVAKKISEYSNGQISPIQADHMLRGYSGTSMNYVWQMVEFLSNPQASPSLSGRQAAEMPVVGTLFARKDGGRKLGEAYEVRDLADQAAASLRLRLREGTPIEAPERERLNREMGFDQAIEPINQALTALNQRERALRRDIRMGRVTGTQAKPELDDIRRRKLDLSERVLEIRKRMVPGG